MYRNTHTQTQRINKHTRIHTNTHTHTNRHTHIQCIPYFLLSRPVLHNIAVVILVSGNVMYENTTADEHLVLVGLKPYTRHTVAVRAKSAREVGPEAALEVMTSAEGKEGGSTQTNLNGSAWKDMRRSEVAVIPVSLCHSRHQVLSIANT